MLINLGRWVPAVAAAVSLCGAASALASQPAVWTWADDSDFRRGNLDGLALHPTLGLTAAPPLQRIEVDADFIHCKARDGAKLWLGTGLHGKVFVLEGSKVREVAKVDAPMVASLLPDGAGGVYAGLVGNGQIVHVTGDGKVSQVAKVDANHVWSLAKRGGALYAGTGPGGKVFSVDTGSKTTKLYAETGADHVLVLADGGDALYAGTADQALLLRIDGEKQVRALASFPGAEVRALARSGKAWYAAVNGGQTAAPLANLKPTAERPGTSPPAKTPAAGKTGKESAAKGKGAIWKRSDDGIVARMYVSPEGMLSDLGVVGNKVMAGAARGGRVVIGDDFGDVQSLFDVKEEEILGIEVGPSGAQTLLTGKSAAVYLVGQGDGAPAYTTEVLSETGIAQWGRIDVVGEGDLTVETRSGFSDPPSDTWNPWTAIRNGQIASPAANFLQVRVKFGSGARLVEMRASRQVVNRAPMVTKIDAVPNKQKGTVALSWAADDPDGDALGFVVTYRPRGSKPWIKLHDRFYDKKSMELSPSDMPDGWYEVRIEVSDAGANGPRDGRATARLSKAFLVDRGKPELQAELKGRVLTGSAKDDVSRIVKVEVSVDGEPTMLASAKDGVFDGVQEAWDVDLGPAVEKGVHVVLVTTWDDAGNSGTLRLNVGN